MTLTYLGPTVGAGDLIVPAASEVALDPLLAEAVLLLRASQFTGADGDDWVNEGTGGSAYDAFADPAGASDPHYVTSPEPGFEMGGVNRPPNYQVPDGAAIEAGTGSFTIAARILYTGPDEAFGPVIAKLAGAIGVDGAGWWMGTGTALGPGVGVLINQGTASFVAAISTTELVVDTEYLLVVRLNRSGNTLKLFVDGTEVASADSSTITDVTCAHEIVISRTLAAAQTGRDYAYWGRALTDTEITVDLPAALGV